jgi:hypothetical protein
MQQTTTHMKECTTQAKFPKSILRLSSLLEPSYEHLVKYLSCFPKPSLLKWHLKTIAGMTKIRLHNLVYLL